MKKTITGIVCMVLVACMVMTESQAAAVKNDGTVSNKGSENEKIENDGKEEDTENINEETGQDKAENTESEKEKSEEREEEENVTTDNDTNESQTGKEDTEELTLEKPALQTSSRPNGTIKISWNRIDGANEYVLFRSTKKDAGFHKIFKANKAYHYTDKQRIAGQVYYYKLSAYTKGHTKRAESKITKGRSLEKVNLNGISNLSGSRKLTLQWKRVKGAAGYKIKRKNKTGKYQTIATVKGEKTNFTDKKLYGGKIYTYKVCAIDANGGRGNLSKSSSQMAIDANRKMIALTYDDGPCIYTPAVLDALEKYEAHATFFVVGSSVNRYAESIRREAALGCEIGNHTYHHANLKKLSAAQVRSAILETNRVVKQQCGLDIHVMRPPGGDYNSTVCAEVGMPIIMWSVATQDWKTRSSAATIQCVKQNAFDGAVVIMHDLHKSTADAADTIVGYLKSAGYQMVTISEMAAYRGGMKAGKVYSQFRK